jgi:hypothetical protein
MHRRNLLGFGAAAISAALLGEKPTLASVGKRGRPKTGRPVSFFVAGARFYATKNLKASQPVLLKADLFQGARSYSIYAGESKIGHAPLQLISTLADAEVSDGWLCVDESALPWTRYQVTVLV